MSNKCSAPGCKGNYSSTDGYVTVFKLPLAYYLYVGQIFLLIIFIQCVERLFPGLVKYHFIF